MDIYSHIVNKWANDYIGKTVEEVKELMIHDFADYHLHVISIQEEDPRIELGYNDRLRLKNENRYTPNIIYTQKFFVKSVANMLQVIEYKGKIVDTKIY
jgi:hypothetical protein